MCSNKVFDFHDLPAADLYACLTCARVHIHSYVCTVCLSPLIVKEIVYVMQEFLN